MYKISCMYPLVGYTTTPMYPNGFGSAVATAYEGAIRLNGAFFEVQRNGMWQAVDISHRLSLDPEMMCVLEWAKQRMLAENKIAAMADELPAVQAALENYRQAADDLKTVLAITGRS